MNMQLQTKAGRSFPQNRHCFTLAYVCCSVRPAWAESLCNRLLGVWDQRLNFRTALKIWVDLHWSTLTLPKSYPWHRCIFCQPLLVFAWTSRSCGSAGALGISTGAGSWNPTNQWVVTWSFIPTYWRNGNLHWLLWQQKFASLKTNSKHPKNGGFPIGISFSRVDFWGVMLVSGRVPNRQQCGEWGLDWAGSSEPRS